MVQPVSPDEVKQAHATGVNIPPQVVEVVNDLIIKSWNGSSASVFQEDIIQALSDVWNASEIYDNKYLDFEELFRSHGWKVIYDKPGYNETYKPFFKFSPRGD